MAAECDKNDTDCADKVDVSFRLIVFLGKLPIVIPATGLKINVVSILDA